MSLPEQVDVKETLINDIDAPSSMGIVGSPGVVSLKEQQLLVLVEREVRTAEWFPMEKLLSRADQMGCCYPKDLKWCG